MKNLEPLCAEIAREQNALLAQGDRRALIRQRLLGGNPRSDPFRRQSGLRWALAAAGALGAAAGAYYWKWSHLECLTATVGESRTRMASGSWIDAPETASVPLNFSDGTSVEIAARSRARLLELGKQGAQLALESGHAEVNVAHGNDRHWELRAGPFTVIVTGTRFHLAWNPNEDQFELMLSEGQVELVGCGFGAGRKLVAGQLVRASCRNSSVNVAYSESLVSKALPTSPQTPPAASTTAETNANPLPDESQAHATRGIPGSAHGSASTNQSNQVATTSTWIALVKQGKYDAALKAVERLGFAEESMHLGGDQLAMLADAARHARNPERARQALTLLRQRFPGTNQAGLAAFSLGVLEFDQRGAYLKAAEWFRLYLKETPSGPLTREARGRIMEASYRAGTSDVGTLATEYLRDYPKGPHAALAEVILRAKP